MKTWQMIKTLQENPKARFKNMRCEDVVSAHKDGFLTWEKKGTHYEMTFAGFSDCCSGNSDDDWEVVPAPAPFEVALQALYIAKQTIVLERRDGTKIIYRGIEEPTFRASDIINGKWFIEN